MKKIIPFFRFFILTIFIFGGCYVTAQTINDTTIHAVAEQMPSFPGGAYARNEFLATHLKYPEEALKNRLSGKVYVGFVVEPNGSISHIKVLKGIGHGCDKEAMQVVAQMPKWKPGLINGKLVRVRFTLPFTFAIHGAEDGRVYTKVDDYPIFGIGKSTLRDYLQDSIHYPVGIIKDKVVDTVDVYFIVERDKKITHVYIAKDSSRMNAYDYEAIRLIKTLPVVKPAYLYQQPVRVQLYLPVVFDYTQVDSADSQIFHTIFDKKTFAYYRPDTALTDVDKMPRFPGGVEALMQYLAWNIKYPKEAKLLHEQGRVFIRFVVETDGSITHIRVLRGAAPLLDEEAVRVVRNMPRWIPGSQRGKPVRVIFNLPVKFTLE